VGLSGGPKHWTFLLLLFFWRLFTRWGRRHTAFSTSAAVFLSFDPLDIFFFMGLFLDTFAASRRLLQFSPSSRIGWRPNCCSHPKTFFLFELILSGTSGAIPRSAGRSFFFLVFPFLRVDSASSPPTPTSAPTARGYPSVAFGCGYS